MEKIILIIVIVFLYSNQNYAQDTVKFREYEKEYLTYPFSDPNPIPAEKKIYPYFRYDRFTEHGVKKKWKVIELENNFIKVKIMPEIGGKIWGAVDKKSGKDFLYTNNVVKFRDIALRGRWVSGGIEFNYGIIGHTPNSATPVDYLIKEEPGRSVSCIISTFDLLTRTTWVLEIKLEKDTSYFSTSSYWFNSNSTEQPYYTWMNAGIPAGSDLEFLYPGNQYLGHDGRSYNWPRDDKNRNLSLYAENTFGGSKSFHVFGVHSDYFGGYWKKDDFGMIHFAKRADKLGKKIFLWAQSEQGRIWEDLLTDNSGQYVEIQSGRLFNQNIFESSFTPFKQIGFAPYSSDTWTEYWYPFKGLGGFTSANLLGAFDIKTNKELLSIKINPVKPIRDTLVVYSEKGNILASVFVDANTSEVFEKEISIASENIPTYLVLEGIRVEIDQKETELSRPLKSPKVFDTESSYGLYLQGRDLYRFRNYELSEKKLLASLSQDSLFLPALVEMAKIKLFKMQYDSAYTYAKQALSIDTYHSEANYYYGLSALKINKYYDALDGYEVASLSPTYRGAAYTALSRIYLKAGDYIQATENANLSLQNNSTNLEALKILYLIARLNNNQKPSKLLKDKIERLNPLDHFIRFEKFIDSPTKNNQDHFQHLIKNELPGETYIELAIWYANLNRFEESKMVFEMAPQNPIVYYWLAWLNKNDENREISKKYIDKAQEASVDFIFPFREETAKILQWASNYGKSWKENYFLALIEEFRGNEKRAFSLIEHYEDVKFAPFYILKARLNPNSTIESRLQSISKAVSLQPKEWRYGNLLAANWLENGRVDKAIETLEKYYKADKENYIIGLSLVDALIHDERYTDSEQILSNLTILPFEGANEAKQYFRQTKLMIAFQAVQNKNYPRALKKIDEAEKWPLNLGVGRPYPELINNDLENAMRARIYEEMGNLNLKQKYVNLLKDKTIGDTDLLQEIKSLIKRDKRLF